MAEWQLPRANPFPMFPPQDKKDFVVKRVKRLLKAGVVSALACMVKADSAILTDQSKELIARCLHCSPGSWECWAAPVPWGWTPGVGHSAYGGAWEEKI